MLLSELIEKAEELKELNGDVEVYVSVDSKRCLVYDIEESAKSSDGSDIVEISIDDYNTE